MEQAERKTDLNAICIAACFGAIYNHVFGYRFFDAPGLGGPAAQFAFFVSKLAAPLFFMISGALLLEREDSYKKAFARILRMGVVLILMCAFYALVHCLETGEPFDIVRFIQTIYRDAPQNTNVFPLLYCYLGVLVMLPVLQRLAGGLKRKDFLYFLLIAAFWSGCMPIVRHLWPGLPGNPHLDLSVFSFCLAMPLTGLYIERHTVLSRGGMRLAACGALLFTACSVALTRLDPNAYANGRLFYDNCAYLPTMAAAACVFYLYGWMHMRVRAGARLRRGAAALGRLTLCVYLFSDFFIRLLEPARAFLTQSDASYAGTLLYALAVYACGALLAAALTRVPGLKKLL